MYTEKTFDKIEFSFPIFKETKKEESLTCFLKTVYIPMLISLVFVNVSWLYKMLTLRRAK